LEPGVTSPNLIGGHSDNSVTAGAHGAAIGGGGQSGTPNHVTDDHGVVGGGRNNRAGDDAGSTVDAGYATVGGGYGNTASHAYATIGGGIANDASGQHTTVGGGYDNTASGLSATVGGGRHNTAGTNYAVVSGGYDNQASGGTSTVGGGYVNTASGNFAVVPGGRDNTAQGDYSLAAGRRAKADHDGTFVWADSTDADFGSTAADQFLVRASGGMTVTVAGGALRLEPDADSPNLVGGYAGNSVTAGARSAAIGGGGESGYTNRVTDAYGVVGGGRNNQAGDGAGTPDDAANATVGGGNYNTASGFAATVGGGDDNTASGIEATVGGGYHNTASGHAATVGGGYHNTASGSGATVPGGRLNTAQGDYSLAAGYRAEALHEGAFVWADSTNAVLASTAGDTFLVRASGGIWFGTTSLPSTPSGRFINTSTGGYLSTGGVWTDLSDRDLKENLVPVDGQEVLARLAAVPISTWNYKAQDPDVRHMGPTAQDFAAAFGLGEDDTHIASLDASGVALAAIQALHAQNQEQAARLDALEVENAGLRQQLDALEARLSALESGSQAGARSHSPQSGIQPAWLLGGLLAVGCVVVAGRRVRAGGGS
jgi:hypothetical protein